MINPDQIWAEAVRVLERGKPFVLATVVNVRGSTPREVGAKMIVRDDGQFGTIGGGCGEAEVFRKAEVLLQDGPGARLVEVDLTGDFDQDQRGTCGGIMDVFIDRWSPEADLAMARRLAEAASRNAPAALLTLIDDGARAGVRALIDPDGGEPDGPKAVKMLENNLKGVPTRVLSPAGRARVAPLKAELEEFLEDLRRETENLQTL